MHDIQVFLTVKIRDTGRLAAIGNFFLAPVRYCFSGKSIAVIDGVEKEDRGISEVPSFYWGKTIRGRRDNRLQSTNTDQGYAEPFLWLGFTLAVIPGVVLGSFFKMLSYWKNPIAQEHHAFVKEKLTPKDKTIECLQDQKADTGSIEKRLHHYSLTGQHTKSLIISNHSSEEKKIALDDKCMDEILRHINPSKLILEKVEVDQKTFTDCAEKINDENKRLNRRLDWDIRALQFFEPKPDRGGDYSSQSYQADSLDSPSSPKPQKRTSLIKSFAFLNPRPSIPTVVSTIEEALKKPPQMDSVGHRADHTVFVVGLGR